MLVVIPVLVPVPVPAPELAAAEVVVVVVVVDAVDGVVVIVAAATGTAAGLPLAIVEDTARPRSYEAMLRMSNEVLCKFSMSVKPSEFCLLTHSGLSGTSEVVVVDSEGECEVLFCMLFRKLVPGLAPTSLWKDREFWRDNACGSDTVDADDVNELSRSKSGIVKPVSLLLSTPPALLLLPSGLEPLEARDIDVDIALCLFAIAPLVNE